MKTITYEGLLSLHDYGEASEILFLSSVGEPFAEELGDKISNKQVTVRYWITDKQVTKEEANKAFIEKIVGKASCEFQSHYSEITGYLWTDEEINVGGHDLLSELKDYVGKRLILEIDIY